jgi:hypothetical protein
MPLITPGTPVTERIFFNTGYIDFGLEQLVNVDNVTVEITFSEKELRRLNSIKMASHKRATFKCSLRAKLKSVNKEVFAVIFGTSAPDGSGTLITVKDGQPDELNPVFTGYIDDDPSKPVQFQFTDAVCTAMPLAATLENYGEVDFTMEARDVSVFYFD